MSNTLMEILNKVRDNKDQITIIIANGYQMNGTVVKYDNDCIVFRDAKSQRCSVIRVNNISTINIPDSVVTL